MVEAATAPISPKAGWAQVASGLAEALFSMRSVVVVRSFANRPFVLAAAAVLVVFFPSVASSVVGAELCHWRSVERIVSLGVEAVRLERRVPCHLEGRSSPRRRGGTAKRL